MAVMLFYFVFSSGADRCPCREAAHRPEQKRPGSIYSIKTVMTEYVSYRLADAVSWCRAVCVSVCVCLGRPGRDWHEALAAKCNLHPDGERPAADIHPGGAGGSVRPTHTDAGEHTHLLVAELFFFFKVAPWCLLSPVSFSEKLMSCFLVTPTCRELSQSGGATGF